MHAETIACMDQGAACSRMFYMYESEINLPIETWNIYVQNYMLNANDNFIDFFWPGAA